MPTIPSQIQPELPQDNSSIDILHEVTFGPGRFARTAFRLREGVPHDMSLSFTAWQDGGLIGSVRLTPVAVGGTAGQLLGPLAVLPAHKNKGTGKALVAASVAAAREAGHRFVMLVGDEPYYGPLGFRRVPFGSVLFPGPVDPNRILVADLADDGAPISGMAMAAA